MFVHLPNGSAFRLDLLVRYAPIVEGGTALYFRWPDRDESPFHLRAAYEMIDTPHTCAEVRAAIEAAQRPAAASIPGEPIMLEAFDFEAAFGRLEALIKAPATEEQVERSLRTNLAVAQRLAESGEPISTLNLRAEFDQIRMLVMDLRDELAEHRRTE